MQEIDMNLKHLSSSPNPNSANWHTLPTADESAIAGTNANRMILLDGPPIQTNQFLPSGDVSHKSFARVLKENPTAPNHTQDDVSPPWIPDFNPYRQRTSTAC